MEVTEIVRLTHPRFYSEEHGRFVGQAFTINGAGASVVATACVESSDATLCEHLRKFYPGIGGEPPVFLRINTASLADGARLVQSDSLTGDACHYDIVGMTKGQLRRLIVDRSIDEFEICDGSNHRSLNEADLLGRKDLHRSNATPPPTAHG